MSVAKKVFCSQATLSVLATGNKLFLETVWQVRLEPCLKYTGGLRETGEPPLCCVPPGLKALGRLLSNFCPSGLPVLTCYVTSLDF
jgi:hypothetical protein